jgi:hypothetical protein
MSKYLGVKVIEAEPMNLGDYNNLRGWTIPENEDPATEGYMVQYDSGYKSWSPKAIFESAYLPLEGDGSTITESVVDGFINKEASTCSKAGTKTSILRIETISGFEYFDASSCVDVKNFDLELGCSIASGRIKGKIWEALGFVLSWGNAGLKPKKIVVEEKSAE